MLIVAGEIVVGAESRDAAAVAAREMALATRQEDGCVTYRFYADLEDDTRFHVFEIWQSAEHLARHFETPHMKEFRSTLGALDIKSRDITKYEVSNAVSL